MGSTYRAFISYSHADAAFARWLHARLETYQLPGELARLLPAGERRGRLGPVFRDREELPASIDLSASVREALAASDVLIVLCSPDARQSAWVGREIEVFRELGPDRPILAAIVRGEPAEAFPPPLLQGREPLAADLRKQGDGRRLGFLKIVAGIAGVPLDALVQRDAQRKLRRVIAVTLVTSAAAIVLAVMTVIAIRSGNEATRQKAGAEGLVEFMLTDLRADLRGVGRLDLMTRVNQRALAYYSAQNLADLPADSLERWARILHAMVEDETQREDGDLDLAARIANQAHRTTSHLLRNAATDPDLVFAQGQSEYWVGHVYEAREDYEAAGKWYARYRASSLRLQALEPGSLRTLMERGFGELNMGIVSFGEHGSNPEAIAWFERAVGWFSQAEKRAANPKDARTALANAYAWLADMHYKAGDYAAALRAQAEGARLKRLLANADRRDLDKYFDLLVAERALALTRYHLGDRGTAREEIARLIPLTLQLSARDPDNRQWSYIAEKTQADLAQLD